MKDQKAEAEAFAFSVTEEMNEALDLERENQLSSVFGAATARNPGKLALLGEL